MSCCLVNPALAAEEAPESSIMSPAAALLPKARASAQSIFPSQADSGRLQHGGTTAVTPPGAVATPKRPAATLDEADRTIDNPNAQANNDHTLRGEIIFSALSDSIAPCLDELLSVALDRDKKTKDLIAAVQHYGSPLHKAFKGTMDAVNYMLCNRGFLPSTEVGAVLLDEDHSLKSRNLAELANQKQIDDTHVKIVSTVMQLSMGLGMTDRSRGAEITGKALVSLNDLVGPDETNKTFKSLREWSKRVLVPEAIYSQKIWDIKDHQDKVNAIVHLALSKDPVAEEVTKKIHKYSHHGKIVRASASLLETSLNAATLTPTLIGPAAQAALLAFFMSTGGTEEDKIIREVYLDKRLQSRADVIRQKANLAMTAYQTALLTRNSVLLGLSESIVKQMAGPEAVQQAFGASVLRPARKDSSTAAAARATAADKPEVSSKLDQHS